MDVLAELRGKNGVHTSEPEDADPCDYHWHGSKFLCPTKMYRVLGFGETESKGVWEGLVSEGLFIGKLRRS